MGVGLPHSLVRSAREGGGEGERAPRANRNHAHGGGGGRGRADGTKPGEIEGAVA